MRSTRSGPRWAGRGCDHACVPLPPRDSIDHAPGRPQHWSDADADVTRWVIDTVDRIDDVLSTAAVYLHGSLAMGSYFRPKSDVDLLVIADEAPSDPDRRCLAVRLLAAFDERPTIGGVELSIVRRRHVAHVAHPLPYEFHFSEKWADDVRHGGAGPRGTDRDLAAHCAMTRHRGIALRGDEPGAVIGPVPHDAFVDSIMDDFRWIVDGGILESPFYGVLNLCRVLHIFAEGPDDLPSKEEAAVWALEHLPVRHHPIITEALACYRSAAEIPADRRRTHGHTWNDDALVALTAFARRAVALAQ